MQGSAKELNRRALGITPAPEAERLREVFACPELQPRHFRPSLRAAMAAFEQIEHNVGRATALAYCMLSLAGQRKEERSSATETAWTRWFGRLVSAPAVSQALDAKVPESPHGLFRGPCSRCSVCGARTAMADEAEPGLYRVPAHAGHRQLPR